MSEPAKLCPACGGNGYVLKRDETGRVRRLTCAACNGQRLADNAARLKMQDAIRLLEQMFPGRALCFFVIKGAPDQQTHYAANARRGDIITVMKELIASQEPLRGIPENEAHN